MNFRLHCNPECNQGVVILGFPNARINHQCCLCPCKVLLPLRGCLQYLWKTDQSDWKSAHHFSKNRSSIIFKLNVCVHAKSQTPAPSESWHHSNTNSSAVGWEMLALGSKAPRDPGVPSCTLSRTQGSLCLSNLARKEEQLRKSMQLCWMLEMHHLCPGLSGKLLQEV